MSIPNIVTQGIGNGTFSGSIADIVLRGFSIGEEVGELERQAFSGQGRMMYSQLADYYVLNPSTSFEKIFPIGSEQDLDALAINGVITITERVALVLENFELTTSNRFVLDGGNLAISTRGGPSALQYSGTDTFISGQGSFFTDTVGLVNTNFQATLLDLVGGNATFFFAPIIRWADLGSFTIGTFTMRFCPIVAWGSGFTLNRNGLINIFNSGAISSPPNGVLFNITNTVRENQVIEMFNIPGRMGSDAALVRLDPALLDTTRATIIGSTLATGKLFDDTGADGTFTAVADATVASTVISIVAASGDGSRFNFTPGPAMFVGQEVTIAGYVTNTGYNGTYRITGVGTGYFEVDSIPFGTDESGGSFTSDSVTLTSTAHGLSEGDAVKVDTDNADDYDGGSLIYDVQTNTFRINRTWNVTRTGTWSTKGLDQKDPKILAKINSNFTPSEYIGCCYVNGNTTSTSIPTNNTFEDIQFGPDTANSLIQCTNTERWKLLDPIIGEWEYIGLEPFDGSIVFDFTATSSGGAREFRFKWVESTDGGSTFADLPDPVEALVEIGSSASSTTKHIPLKAETGHIIKPQVTRNTGTSSVTVSYATHDIIQGG